MVRQPELRSSPRSRATLLLLGCGLALCLGPAEAPAAEERGVVGHWRPVVSIPNQASYLSDRCGAISVDVRIHYIVQRPDTSWSGQFLDFLNRKPRDLAERNILVLEVELEGQHTRYDLQRESLLLAAADGSFAPELLRFEGEGGIPWIAPKYTKYLYAFRVAQEVGNVVYINVPDREGECAVPPLPLEPLSVYRSTSGLVDPS